MAEMLGMTSASFLETHPDIIQDLKFAVLKFHQTLQMKQICGDLPFAENAKRHKIALTKTPSGFPVIPIPFESENLVKKDWEKLFSTYVGMHYSKCVH